MRRASDLVRCVLGIPVEGNWGQTAHFRQKRPKKGVRPQMRRVVPVNVSGIGQDFEKQRSLFETHRNRTGRVGNSKTPYYATNSCKMRAGVTPTRDSLRPSYKNVLRR